MGVVDVEVAEGVQSMFLVAILFRGLEVMKICVGSSWVEMMVTCQEALVSE